jgi:uncharacterized membrane protein (DUF373 family)
MQRPSVLDFALGVAVAIFVLAVLDVFLSDSQKKWFDDRTLHAWHWLAEAKRKSLLNWLQRHYQFIAWTGVVLVSVYMTWAFEKALAPLPQVITVALCIFAIGLLFGLKIVQLTLRAPSLFRAVMRATIAVVVTLLPAIVFLTLVKAFNSDLVGLAKAYGAAAAAHQLATLGQALFALYLSVCAYIVCPFDSHCYDFLGCRGRTAAGGLSPYRRTVLL